MRKITEEREIKKASVHQYVKANNQLEDRPELKVCPECNGTGGQGVLDCWKCKGKGCIKINVYTRFDSSKLFQRR